MRKFCASYRPPRNFTRHSELRPVRIRDAKRKAVKSEGLTVTSNYFAAEDGVTERSRRFLHFQGSFIGHRLIDIAQFHIADKVEDNLDAHTSNGS